MEEENIKQERDAGSSERHREAFRQQEYVQVVGFGGQGKEHVTEVEAELNQE